MPGVRHPAPSRHKYLAIAADLERAIRSRRLKPGHNIPSERELSEHYGATRQTVRAALDRLHAAELVLRDRLGTYVLCEGSGEDGGHADSPPGPAEGFPGLLLQTEVLHCTGLLTGSAHALADTRAGDDDDADRAADGHAPFLYRHWAHAHDGRIVQSSISSFHHRLVNQAPPLAKAVKEVRASGAGTQTRARGIDPDLGELLGWLSLRFPDAQRTDQVRALPHTAPHAVECGPGELHPTAHVHIVRTFRDANGPVLLRTVFHVFDDRALLTFQPGIAALDSTPGPAAQPPASSKPLRINERDRAWLEAWLLPGAADRGLATRARIILTCAEASVQQAAARLNLSDDVVRAWLGRYAAGGVDALRQPVRAARHRDTAAVIAALGSRSILRPQTP
ncbi:MAG TPA: GntR family transcriptional regulator [Actinospica sp.]|jgi:hypothetical protein|nr:GntR family transcriptional regulator [Actinospica sp.]